jgi:predicted CopG family antitoxin
MGHKTLTVSEEAYEALARMKKERESFTEAILRLTDKREKGTLLDYVLSLEPDEEFAEELEKVVKERRKIVVAAPRFG